METPSEINWPELVWVEINEGVVKEIMTARVAQRVFPTMTFDNHSTQIRNEVINFTDLSIKEGPTRSYSGYFKCSQ